MTMLTEPPSGVIGAIQQIVNVYTHAPNLKSGGRSGGRCVTQRFSAFINTINPFLFLNIILTAPSEPTLLPTLDPISKFSSNLDRQTIGIGPPIVSTPIFPSPNSKYTIILPFLGRNTVAGI